MKITTWKQLHKYYETSEPRYSSVYYKKYNNNYKEKKSLTFPNKFFKEKSYRLYLEGVEDKDTFVDKCVAKFKNKYYLYASRRNGSICNHIKILFTADSLEEIIALSLV